MSKKQKISYRINSEITYSEIRIIGDGMEPKICSIQEAIKIAESLGVDVVEINSKSNPVICKLIRYDKFLYEEKRKLREIEKKNREQRVEVKEIRLSPNIDSHDIEFKLKHAINFLKDNDKVKITMKFGGRQIVYKNNGEKVILEFASKLIDFGLPESMPKLEGKKMFMIIKPIK